jgi:antitoxin MazE
LYIQMELAMKVKLAKWGNSLGVRFPKAATQAAGVSVGTEFDLSVEDGGFRLRAPAKSSRQLLEEMVAEAKRLGPEFEPETVEWGPDRGSEILPEDDYSRGEITPDDLLSRRDAARRR